MSEMTTYLHPDLEALRQALTEQGFVEVVEWDNDFTLVYNRHGEVVMIDLPEGEVYESIDVYFDFDTDVSLLVVLGFPL